MLAKTSAMTMNVLSNPEVMYPTLIYFCLVFEVSTHPEPDTSTKSTWFEAITVIYAFFAKTVINFPKDSKKV